MNPQTVFQPGKKMFETILQDAKIDYDNPIAEHDQILALDEESPFLVLVKSDAREKIFWAVDFLLSERMKGYKKIPRIKVNDYVKVARCI